MESFHSHIFKSKLQEIDFALGPLVTTIDRDLVADQSTILLSDQYTLLSSGINLHHHGSNLGLHSLIKNLSPHVWIMTLISFCYILPTFSIIDLIIMNRKNSRNFKLKDLGIILLDNLWAYFSNILNQRKF